MSKKVRIAKLEGQVAELFRQVGEMREVNNQNIVDMSKFLAGFAGFLGVKVEPKKEIEQDCCGKDKIVEGYNFSKVVNSKKTK